MFQFNQFWNGSHMHPNVTMVEENVSEGHFGGGHDFVEKDTALLYVSDAPFMQKTHEKNT